MRKENMQNLSKSGNISFELEEIQKMQTKSDGFLTISTSTCGEFYTVICC